MSEEVKTIKVQCNKCSGQTNHTIMYDKSFSQKEIYRQDPYDDGIPLESIDTWRLLQCCGCNEVVFEKQYYFSEWGDDQPAAEYYPPRVGRKAPDWIEHLDPIYKSLLEEIYISTFNGCRRLALMGTRSLIDTFIRKTVKEQRTFADGLKKLQEKGFVSANNFKTLRTAVDAGHASIHRDYVPTSDQLNTVLDIVENLLQNLTLKKSAKSLSRAVPKKKKTRKKNV